MFQNKMTAFFNEASLDDLRLKLKCSLPVAKKVVALRPFIDKDDLVGFLAFLTVHRSHLFGLFTSGPFISHTAFVD